MNAATICNNTQAFVTNLTIFDYVERFQSFLNKSAEAVLEMGQVVYSASKNLEKTDFADFCVAVRLGVSSSAISKLKTIGKQYDRLIEHKAKLPQAWTTLYYLAKVNDEKFQDGINHHLIHPTMTANELKILDPKLIPTRKQTGDQDENSTDDNKQTNNVLIQVGMVIDSKTKAELMDELKAICDKYNCELIDNI
jgi:hypothetical protein